MREGEMRQIAGMIGAAVRCDPAHPAGERRLAEIAEEAADLVRRFPAYGRAEVMT
jgi:glycine hydroxymethyltransferase